MWRIADHDHPIGCENPSAVSLCSLDGNWNQQMSIFGILAECPAREVPP
ncbi:MAG TPA: hypothetical protein VH701_19970 [Vicinamibacterales bacterium]